VPRNLSLGSRRDESLGVEIVVRAHEQRAEPAEGGEVGRRCGSNVDRHQKDAELLVTLRK
jgi:hypothetical protein